MALNGFFADAGTSAQAGVSQVNRGMNVQFRRAHGSTPPATGDGASSGAGAPASGTVTGNVPASTPALANGEALNASGAWQESPPAQTPSHSDSSQTAFDRVAMVKGRCSRS